MKNITIFRKHILNYSIKCEGAYIVKFQRRENTYQTQKLNEIGKQSNIENDSLPEKNDLSLVLLPLINFLTLISLARLQLPRMLHFL